MREITDYGKVFETLVTKTAAYLVSNNIKAQILGISGGIDSTVCAAICHEVAKRTGIPLIGRSLPTNFNKENEISTADLVGKAFCADYKVCNVNQMYFTYAADIILNESGDVYYDIDYDGNIINLQDDFLSPIARGNIQARLRMIYLYNLASIHRGLVIDTDNLTENNLGYFTIHGDVGDFNPIGGLWKTEVFELAEWYKNNYVQKKIKDTNDYFESGGMEVNGPTKFRVMMDDPVYKAFTESLKLKPTAGLGITDSDLDEIGAESYEQVDSILREILSWKWLSLEKRGDTYNSIWDMRNAFLEEHQMLDTPIEVIIAVTDRHFKSEFKRKKLPIKINRDEII